MENLIVLEKSTNSHFTKSKDVTILAELDTMTTVVLETKNTMIVEHGHHFSVATDKDTPCVIKITQQEYNPLLEAFQNSFD